MTEQSTLLTLLLIRLDTDRPQTPVVGQLLARMAASAHLYK